MDSLQTYRKGQRTGDDLENKYGAGVHKKRNAKHSGQSQHGDEQTPASENLSSTKKTGAAQKFVNLYSQEGQEKLVLKLPGSHPCNCQASKHRLVNNCTNCGRIVCDQEGSGPCYFCANLVCSADEQEILNAGGKKSVELRKKLLFSGKNRKSVSDEKSAEKNAPGIDLSLNVISEDLKRATADKNRLLEYQQNSAMRTKVYDDEADYYNIENSQWLTQEQREIMKKRNQEALDRKKLAASKLNQKITIDLANRQILLDSDCALFPRTSENSILAEDHFSETLPKLDSPRHSEGDGAKGLPRPVYLASSDGDKKLTTNQISLDSKIFRNPGSRIQDLGYKEVQDLGCCLSMHQPYASLLVRGIKKFEGRGWYIKHRGILWIASTAKSAQHCEIEEVQSFYMHLYAGNLPAPFPGQFPSGCLLGCVNIDDCLTQEQFRGQYPLGESESPYVAICSDPRELSFNLPISGQHKIYKLDPKIHATAQRVIEGSSNVRI